MINLSRYVLGFLLAAFVGLFLFPVLVYAHAYVVQSEPVPNQTLDKAPHVVTVRFDENVQLGSQGIEVFNEDGKRVDLQNGHLLKSDAHEIECSLPGNLPKGIYTIHWQVISEDGHMVEGTIPFGIQMNAKSIQLSASTTSEVPGPWLVTDRTVFYIAMTLFIGLSLFWRFIGPQRRLALTKGKWLALILLWAALFVSIAFSLPIQTANSWGAHGLQALRPAVNLRTLNLTIFGYVWIVQMLIVLLLPFTVAAFLAQRCKSHWWLCAAPLYSLPVSKAFIGHAVSSTTPVLAIIVDSVHLLAASVWIGGITGVAWMLCNKRTTADGDVAAEQIKVIGQFSMVAVASVLLLGITGFWQAVTRIPTWYALLHTDYGQTLLVKLALFAIMLLLTVFHWRKRQSIQMQSVRVAVIVEMCIGFLVLGVTSWLANLPTAEASPGPFHGQHTVQSTQISLSVTPNQAGKNQFEVTLREHGKPRTDLQQVELSFTCKTIPGDSDEVILKRTRPGVYEASGLYLSGAGKWQATVDVLTDDFQDLSTVFPIAVGQ